MFERYTERARRCVFYARYEAAHRTPPIDPEHLLLGVLRDDSPFLHQLLAMQGVDVAVLRRDLEAKLPSPRPEQVSGDIPLSPRAKHVLALAAAESEGLSYLGLEHIVLGLLQEGGAAAEALQAQGLEAPAFRSALHAFLEERK